MNSLARRLLRGWYYDLSLLREGNVAQACAYYVASFNAFRV